MRASNAQSAILIVVTVLAIANVAVDRRFAGVATRWWNGVFPAGGGLDRGGHRARPWSATQARLIPLSERSGTGLAAGTGRVAG